MGQQKTVRVFQLITEDTIESKVLDIRKSSRFLSDKISDKFSASREEERRSCCASEWFSYPPANPPGMIYNELRGIGTDDRYQAFAKSGKVTAQAKKEARFEDLKELFGVK